MQRATLITPAEYARSRGLAKSTISRQIRDKKIPTHKGGLIDPREADEARRRNLDMSRRPYPDSGLPDEVSGGTAHEIFLRARAANMLTAAKERQLAFKKRQGELVEVEDMKRVWTNVLARFESRMFQLGDIVAPRVAATDDVLEIRALINAEVKQALRALYEADADGNQ